MKNTVKKQGNLKRSVRPKFKKFYAVFDIDLLKAVDSYAKKRGLTRSALIASSLRKELGRSA